MATPPHIGVKGGILPGFQGKTIIRSGLVHDQHDSLCRIKGKCYDRSLRP
jgi:hypothetical protein